MQKQFQEDILQIMIDQNNPKIVETLTCCLCGKDSEILVELKFIEQDDKPERFGENFNDKVSWEVMKNNFHCEKCQKFRIEG